MARRKWNYDTIQQVVDGNNPFIQVGYTGPSKNRKVGDEWTDGKGITWKKTSQDGVVRVNKQMDAIRDIVRARCSVCNADMSLFAEKMDWKIYNKTGKCMDCLEIEELTLKVTGKYDDYEYKKMLKNKLGALKEFRKNVEEAIEFLKKDDSKIEMVHANGDITTWVGSQNEKLLKEAQEDLIKADKEIIDIEDAVSKLD